MQSSGFRRRVQPRARASRTERFKSGTSSRLDIRGGVFHLRAVLPRFPLLLAAALLAAQSLRASSAPVEIDRSFAVGDGIAEFVPKGYDHAKMPSLALVSEPAAQGEVGAGWKISPVFTEESDLPVTGTAAFFSDILTRFHSAHIDAPAGTSFYGTGEATGPLLRNNTTIGLWNTDNFEWKRDKGSRLYQSHPWVLGVRPDGSAFGVLFDTTWKSRLTCGDHTIDLQSQGPAFRVFVIDRDSPEAVLKGLAQLIGTIPLPPKWALGFHQCRYSYFPDSRVREIADGFRSRHIPCDVIWMDIDYMDHFRIFTFDKEKFPDPAATNNYLHEHGFKSIWMIDPGVKAEPGYAIYDSGSAAHTWVRTKDGAEYHGEVWPGQCAFPDFTSPEVRHWWSGLYGDFLAKGVDGVWNDMNEPATFDGPDHSMPETNQHAGGGDLPAGPHLQYHNTFGMLMVRASREGIAAARPERRPFVLTRSNFLGGQRYAATWTGDNGSTWDYMKSSIPMSLNLGLSGQPFSGPDIGGYNGVTAPEVFGHWIALGAFYPFSRAHKAKGQPNSEPWEFGPAVEAAARTAMERRYRLLPYLYTAFYESSQDGLPVMRPLFLADPADAALRGEQQAFTVGRDLLVIPKWAQDPKTPHGNWRSVNLIDATKEADPYQPNLKVRPGAIIPLGKIIQNTTEESLDPLTLLISLDEQGQANGSLYEDDGDGMQYLKNGALSFTKYAAAKADKEIVIHMVARTGQRAVAPRTVKVEILTDQGAVHGEGKDGEDIHVPLP